MEPEIAHGASAQGALAVPEHVVERALVCRVERPRGSGSRAVARGTTEAGAVTR